MSPPPAPTVNDHPRGQARHSAQHWLPSTGLSPRHAEPLGIMETTLIVLWELPNTLSCIWRLINRFPFHRGNIPQNFKNHSHYKMLFLHINELHWYHTERLVKSTPFGTRTSIDSSSDALTWLLFGTWKRPWQAPFPPRGNNATEVPVLKSRVVLLFSHSVVSDSCNPWTAAREAALSFTVSRSLLKLTSIVTTMPSNCLILRCLLPSIFPSIGVFSIESALRIRAFIGASASVSAVGYICLFSVASLSHKVSGGWT